ncbi:MAG: CoA transferase [Hyphomicrobiaceae bacterium]
MNAPAGPLVGLKVIDCATILAGPMAATAFAEFGADVIKIEHPQGDALRGMGLSKDGHGMWWKVVGRNKRSIVLDLKTSDGAAVLKAMVSDADILIENFRTGTLEKWGLGWEELSRINPRLVMVRVTGFGQTGPYKHRAGFGTLAESMSGFAHITGEPDGPPTLPSIGLADGVAAYHGVFAAMFAIYERDVRGSRQGQYIDVALYEPLFSLLGAQSSIYDQLGVVQNRSGNRSVNNVPRNAYKTADDRWVAISTSAPSIARRVMTLVGGEDWANDVRFQTPADRRANAEEIDGMVADWIRARPLTEVLEEFEKVEAAIAPIYSIDQIFEDPQYRARESVTWVDDEDLGKIAMQNVFPVMSRTPGAIRHSGPRIGQHTREILDEMIGAGSITPELADRVEAAFKDRAAKT